ncbi:MAG: Fe-S-containing hydro-lyase [Oscillospiraceae bacterium]
MPTKLELPLTQQKALGLHCGDSLLLSGTLYTARDAAHKRMIEMLKNGQPLPFDLQDATIYYVGPTPAKPGQVIGSAGPTTSYRMDSYTPALLQRGLRGMIGKGMRGPQVVDAMQQHHAVYFGAIGGAGALLARCITSCEPVAFEELGAEAINRLEVKDFPVVVVIDCYGNSLFEH